jgi:hypothetical protein
MNHVDVLTHIGAVIGPDTTIVTSVAGIDPVTGNPNPVTDAHRAEARELYLAVSFLLGADRARYGKMISLGNKLSVQESAVFRSRGLVLSYIQETSVG